MPFLLNCTWILPTLIALSLMFVPKQKVGVIRGMSVAGVLGILALVVSLIIAFLAGDYASPVGSAETTLAFSYRTPWFEAIGNQFYTGVDGFSLLMMLMASIIALCGVLVSWTITDRCKEFFILLFILLAGTFGCFISFDLLTFFLFNEITLIPTYLLIAIFGSGKKEFAAMKLNLMLFGGSALIILGMAGTYSATGSFDMIAIANNQSETLGSIAMWAFPALFMGFGILGSVFPFHTWSPVGHASAPTAISMFLAGVHMKLGGYGCLRAAIYLMPEGAQEWMPLFMVLATISVVYGAFIAIRQRDLKYINAYASISHVGLVTFGFATLTAVGLKGGVLQMISHGFVTAVVFALIGCIYGRTHTRNIDEMGGLMKKIPFLSVCFVLAGFAVVGMPGTSSFVAELTIFIAGFSGSLDDTLRLVCGALCISSIVITAVYVLRTVNSVVHGPLVDNGHEFTDARFIEKVPLIILLTCIFAMGLFPGWIIELAEQSLTPVVTNLGR